MRYRYLFRKPITSRSNHQFFGDSGKKDNFFSSEPVQAKLNIGQPGDKYELEADAVADRVVNGQSATPVLSTVGGLNRKCAECDQEDKVQRVEEEAVQAKEGEEEEVQMQAGEEEEAVQTKEGEEEAVQAKEGEEEEMQTKSSGPAAPGHSFINRLQARKGSGNNLSGPVRAKMESTIGADFSRVRVHNDREANQMSSSIQAQAFTRGNDIYFNSGKYRPESTEGQRLLAHELTHVVQQGEGEEKVQRAAFGGGSAPHSDYSLVPIAEQARVNQSLAIVKKIVDNPKSFPRCHKFFEDNTPGGSTSTLKDVFSRMNVWFDKDNSVFGSSVKPNDLAYSSETWRWGKWSLAGVFIHEMMHLAGQDNENTDDAAIASCRLPDIAEYKRKNK